MQNKVEAWSKKLFKMALEEVRVFFLVNKTNGIRFHPAWYFEKAVDSTHFPDYYTIITNPIDLHLMSRRINGYFTAGNPIELAFQQILSDMELMRNNAHAYNVGAENIEVRICADAVRNFFRYIIRAPLKVVRSFGDDAFNAIVFASTFMQSFVEEEEDEAVLEYLQVSSYSMVAMMEKNNVLKDVGIKNITLDLRAKIEQVTVLGLIKGRVAPSLPPVTATPTTQTSKRSSSSKVTTTSKSKAATSTRVSSGSARTTSKGKETSQAVDDPWDDDSIPIAAYNKSSANAFDDDDNEEESFPAPRSGKRNRSEAYHLDPDAEEDPFEDFAPSKSKKARSSTAPPRQTPMAVVEDVLPIEMANRPAWMETAQTIFKAVTKHPYVDFNSKAVIADFFNPVIEQSPQLAEQYLAKIPQPMDLLQIEQMLFVEFSFLDAREFSEYMQLVFQNCVDFNSSSGAEAFDFIQDLVAKSAHLRRFVRWLCLENFPVHDDSGLSPEDAEEQFGLLRTSQQMEARQERDAIIAHCQIEELNTPFTECKKLLKDLERTRTTEERRRLLTFYYPIDTVNIVDYSVYVRHPMDLSTLKFKLDGTEPTDPAIRKMINMHAPRYTTFGQFLDDLRRIFANAKKYNVVHKDDDTSGLSLAIYEAAIFFGERLESLLPKFSITLADKIECTRMNKSKQIREMEELQRKRLEEEAEKQAIKTRMIEEMKQKDEKFALDTDIERKVQQMEKEVAMRKEASEKAILERNLAAAALSGDAGDVSPATHDSDLSPRIHSPGAISPSTAAGTLQDGGNLQERAVALAASEVAGAPELGGGVDEDRVVYVAGCGALGMVHPQWELEARKKLNSRKKAWDLFSWDIPPTNSTLQLPVSGGAGTAAVEVRAQFTA
jgi:hypothetical protein